MDFAEVQKKCITYGNKHCAFIHTTNCAKSYCPKLGSERPIPLNSAGTIRSNKAGLGRPTLIPSEMLDRVAKWYEGGAVKHGDRNWETGQSFEGCLDSIFRHWNKYKERSTEDDHLAAIIWNAASIIFYETHHPEFDDRPKRDGVILEVCLEAAVTEEMKLMSGTHEEGIGWNPQGVWCGECGNITCEGCPHEHDIEEVSFNEETKQAQRKE